MAKAGRNRAYPLDGNEKELLGRTRERLQVRWGGECRVAKVNINGLRETDRGDALALFLLEFHINVRVATETHRR